MILPLDGATISTSILGTDKITSVATAVMAFLVSIGTTYSPSESVSSTGMRVRMILDNLNCHA
jgi:hypothetical protein